MEKHLKVDAADSNELLNRQDVLNQSRTFAQKL